MIEGIAQTIVILVICLPPILIPAFVAMAGEKYLARCTRSTRKEKK